MANKYRKNIKYYINWKFYREGEKVFEQHFHEDLHNHWKLGEWVEEDDLYEEMMEEIADAAYYCDGYKARNTEEAYFLITEVIGIDEANEWLAERVY